MSAEPVRGQPWASQVSKGIGVLVKMPPQGNLGRWEARVVRKRVGWTLLPLPGIRIGGYNLMVRRDRQIPRKKLPLGVGTVKTWWAGAIDGQLWADTIESWGWWQAKLRGVHVCGRAWFHTLSVWRALTRAVWLELKQLLLPLTFLQLHNADLQTHTRGSHYTRKQPIYDTAEISRKMFVTAIYQPERYILFIV